jgi:hypothetical protein
MRITACNVWVAPEAQVVPQTINFLKYLGLIGTLALIVCRGPGGCAAHRKAPKENGTRASDFAQHCSRTAARRAGIVAVSVRRPKQLAICATAAR